MYIIKRTEQFNLQYYIWKYLVKIIGTNSRKWFCDAVCEFTKFTKHGLLCIHPVNKKREQNDYEMWIGGKLHRILLLGSIGNGQQGILYNVSVKRKIVLEVPNLYEKQGKICLWLTFISKPWKNGFFFKNVNCNDRAIIVHSKVPFSEFSE